MIATIKAALISFTLFVSGGNILSTNFKLHHYSDDDFKEIIFTAVSQGDNSVSEAVPSNTTIGNS